MAQEDDAVSKATREKADHLKRNIEKIMGGRLRANRQRQKREAELEQKLQDASLSPEEKRRLTVEHFMEESQMLRGNRKAMHKMAATDFKVLKVIGKGAFGEVRIVKHKSDGAVYAMKTMRKEMMIAKNQLGHVSAERDLMSEADSPWLVKLMFAFQDVTYLYLVMEFCGGGDLMGLLIKEDILSVEATRFYMSELAAAINYVHKLGFVHRDLKPDNVLIGNDGHIRLSDFGLAKSFKSSNDAQMGNWQQYVATLKPGDLDKLPADEEEEAPTKVKDRKKLYSTVGTPDYIAIEVLYQKGYDKLVDWWSLGVIMFECLVGYAPFHANDPLATCRKIVRYERYFKIPADMQIPREAVDLMKKLVCPAHRRLAWVASKDRSSIPQHPFFAPVDWDNLIAAKPPFVPQLRSEHDHQYFDAVESDMSLKEEGVGQRVGWTAESNRVGAFTWTRDELKKGGAKGFRDFVESQGGFGGTGSGGQ